MESRFRSGPAREPGAPALRPLTSRPETEGAPRAASLRPRPALPPDEPPAPPPSARRRRSWVRLAGFAGALVLLLLAGGVFAAFHLMLGHDDRATAAYAPPGALAYAALNTDPTSKAWVDAWLLAKRAGLDKQLEQLPSNGLDKANADGSSWETAIKPAIGAEVGAAVWPDGAASNTAGVRAALIVMIADQSKAQGAITALLADDYPTSATHRGVSYQLNDRQEAVGIVDHALVFATTSQAFDDVVDAHLDGALGAQQGFQAAAARAASDPLVFAWADGNAIADAFGSRLAPSTAGSNLSSSLASSYLGLAGAPNPLSQLGDTGQITMTLKAEGDALRAVVLTSGRPASFPSAAHSDTFAAKMPASTVFYSSGSDLYTTLIQPELQSLQGAMASQSLSTDELQAAFGIDVDKDLLAHLVGPYAFGVQLDKSGNSTAWQGQLMSSLDDPQAVKHSLDSVARGGLIGGVDISSNNGQYSVTQDGYTMSFGVDSDVLRLSAGTGAISAGGTLADDPEYRQAAQGMPQRAAMSGYVALHRIVGLFASHLDASQQDALNTLGSFSYAAAPDGSGTRTELALFLRQK